MSIFSTISKALPFRITRNPQPRRDPLGSYGWLRPYIAAGTGDRTKQSKVTWNTYYQAADNPVVSACIDAYIIETLAAGFDVYSTQRDADNPDVVSYIRDLYDRPGGPDGMESYAKFMMKGIASYLAPGDWFCEVVQDDTLRGLPVGMYFIQPHRLSYHNDTSQWGLTGSSVRYENDELIHVMKPDPYNELYGKSLIDKAAKDITLDILGMNFNKNYFEGGISPKNFITFSENVPKDVFDDNIARVKLQAKENPRGTYFLHGGQFQDASISNKDMEFTVLMDKVRDRIISTYGVPPKVLGVKTAGQIGGKGDSEEDNKLFKKRVKGLVFRMVEDEFNRVLGKSFDLWGWDERFHFGDIDIEDKTARAQIENVQLRNGSRVVNEIRAGYGLDPVNYGDQPLPYVIGQNGYNQPTEPGAAKSNYNFKHVNEYLQERGLVKQL